MTNCSLEVGLLDAEDPLCVAGVQALRYGRYSHYLEKGTLLWSLNDAKECSGYRLPNSGIAEVLPSVFVLHLARFVSLLSNDLRDYP